MMNLTTHSYYSPGSICWDNLDAHPPVQTQLMLLIKLVGAFRLKNYIFKYCSLSPCVALVWPWGPALCEGAGPQTSVDQCAQI